MNAKALLESLAVALASAGLALVLSLPADAQTETVLHTFSGADGYNPVAGLVFDNKGNLYGTTQYGGPENAGIVFELTPITSGWKESILHSFSGSDGAYPMAGLTIDAQGNLYGTTSSGGNLHYCRSIGCGEVFRLSHASSGGWDITPLYKFTGESDGGQPLAGVIFDSAGNLYGTTVAYGGTNCTVEFTGCGVVFKLTPTSKGPWTETVLHTFTGGSDGSNPFASLLIDAAGNLYGTAEGGGSGACTGGCGIAFELSPTGSNWSFTTLYSFQGLSDGAFPQGVLVSDSAGNLYSTTVRGGTSGCLYFESCGVVFELSPIFSGEWQETVVYTFVGADNGALPQTGLIFDSTGNLFGTTEYGGPKRNVCIGLAEEGCGLVFELTPTFGGWEEKTVFSFNGGNSGGRPVAGLILDSSGNLYGTATYNQSTGDGVVFKVTPSQ